MKKTIKRLSILAVLIFLAVGLLSGCAEKNYVPKEAFVQSAQAVSIPHPVEFEKAGDKYMTISTGILNAGTWGVETNDKGFGVFPLLTEQPQGDDLRGFAIFTNLNHFGDFMLQLMTAGRVERMIASKSLCLDRDGGKVHDLAGNQYDYDPKRFDTDPTYKHDVYQKYGMTLVELQNFWKAYYRMHGRDLTTDIFCEIKIGSPEWENFKALLAETLGHSYKMFDGEIREGYPPVKEFKEKDSYINHGVTPEQRFSRTFKVSPNPIAMVASLVNGLLDASNGPIEGLYARAECLRGDLKPHFLLMQGMFKELLQERDKELYALQIENEQFKKAQNAQGRK